MVFVRVIHSLLGVRCIGAVVFVLFATLAMADGRNEAPAFPLRVAANSRYLEDATGKPFLLHGDTAWSLIAQLKREDAEVYLQDRRNRGFNTLLVSLIEHRFATNAPANAYGAVPFTTPGDFSTPNEAYFAHADWVLTRARDLGYLVMLTPAYIGARGSNEGWATEMAASGSEKLVAYGRYLGTRYGAFDNILWVDGGDDNPADKTFVRAIADGIRETMPRALHTAHCAAETAAGDFWAGEPWLSVNTAYTYGPVHDAVAAQYSRTKMPLVLLESAYENEHKATEQRLRAQSYHALLSGASGQVFGNNPIWHFDGPGIFPAPSNWREALAAPGSVSMTHLRTLLDGLEWWRLEPDLAGTFLSGGIGKGVDRAVAARANDGSFAVLYLPSIREIAVEMTGLSGPQIAARWYDPASGAFTPVKGAPFPATGRHIFKPDTNNSSGHPDWVLLLNIL